MCNNACLAFAAAALSEAEIRGRRVLEVGAQDVNGSVRRIVASRGPASYVGVDRVPGPGVDRVCGVERLVETFGAGAFDLVISTEMLEHVRDWRTAVRQMKDVLAPGGLLLLTTRAPGFPYHGYPEDFWRFEPDEIRRAFAGFEPIHLEPDPSEPGVFLTARKPATSPDPSVGPIAVMCVLTGRREFRVPLSALMSLRGRRGLAAVGRRLLPLAIRERWRPVLRRAGWLP